MPLNRRCPLKVLLDEADPKKVHKFTPEKYFAAHQNPHTWEKKYKDILKRAIHVSDEIVMHPDCVDIFFYDGQVFFVKPGIISKEEA